MDGGRTWEPATLTGATANLTDYSQTVVWRAGVDAPHIDSEDVQFRLTPLDADAGQADVATGIHIDTNDPPTIDVQDILGTVTGDVEIQFTLSDAEGDELFVLGEYSTDDGSSWVPATLAGADVGIPRAGYVGSVVWVSRVDLPNMSAGSTVRVRLIASDDDPGESDTTTSFLLVNTPPPTVEITNVVVEALADVVVEYTLDNPSGRPVDLAAEYSTDGGDTWAAAEVGGATTGISETLFRGALVWDTQSALPGMRAAVLIRLIPRDELGSGPPSVAAGATIINLPLPTHGVGVFDGHTGAVYGVSIAPDDSQIASASQDGTIGIWDVASMVQVASLREYAGQVMAVAYAPDGKTLATATDRLVRLWDTATHEEMRALRGHDRLVQALGYSPDGGLLASGGTDGLVILWDAMSGAELLRLGQANGDQILALSFSPTDGTIAAAGNSGSLRVWDTASGEMLSNVNAFPTSSAASIAFSPDGLWIAAGGGDDTLRVWHATTFMEHSVSTAHSGGTFAVAFSPDGSILASGGGGGAIKLWDVASREALATLTGHGQTVTSVQFSQDGSFLASGSTDRSVRVWASPAIASNREPSISVERTTVVGGEGSIVSIAVVVADPDGDPVTLEAVNGPAESDLDPATGVFTFEPDYTQAGDHTVVFTATDGRFGTDTMAVEIEVTNVDLFGLDAAARSVEEGDTLTLTLTPTVDLPDDISVTAQGLPNSAAFDADARTLTFSPDLTQAGDYAVTFRVTQGGELAEEHAVTITVDEARAFTLEPSDAGAVSEGETLAITAERRPSVGADATLSATGLPDGATFDAETGELRFTPDYTQAGEYVITLEASVGEEVVQTEDVTISVAEANAFTVEPDGDPTVAEGQRLTVTVALADGATEGVTLSVGDRPPHVAFDEGTGTLSFTPDYTHAGAYPITVEATQNGEVVQSTDIAVTVTDTPLLTLTPSVTTVAEGGVVTVVASVLNVAAGDIAMDVIDPPPNTVFDASTGTLTFSPSFAQAGNSTLTVVAMQGDEVASEDSVTVVVENVPTFAINPPGDQDLNEDSSLTITMERAAGVPSGVLFSASSPSRNASYDGTSGTFVFSPDFGQQGSHTVMFKAVQDGEVVDEQDISVTVNDIDILTTNPTGAVQVAEGESVSIAADLASIAQGKVMLSAADLPANAEFDPDLGKLTFSPDHSQSRIYSVTIRAEQDGRSVEQEALRITVTDVNVPPTVIVTAPATDVTGDVTMPYVIEDFDGDPVTLAFEYREGPSEPWGPASLDRSIENTRSYSGSVVWHSREDIPSTGGVDVAFRVTPADAEQGAAATTGEFHVVNLLGDYDDDRFVGFEDLVHFEQAWKAQDISRDIGPAVGDVPDLELVSVRDADLAIDFDDLTTFVRMWNWSADQAPPAVAAMMEASESGEGLSYNRRIDGGDWSTQRVDITAPLGSATTAARLTFAYDPEAVTVRVRDADTPRAVLLTRRDGDAGIVEAQTAWLDTSGDTDPLLSLDLTALRPGDADIRVAFDIRDADGRARRGVDVLPLRFDLPPTATRLLPNYPNPFNPETWIPFELAEASDVTVTIYDVEGSPVRSLHLGRRSAGRYRDRDRAAYWDGRNHEGEAAASGVYVCELRAGDHREIRRMVIRK